MIVVRDVGFNILASIRCLEDDAGIRLRPAEKILLTEVGTVEQMLSIILDSNIGVRVVRQIEHEHKCTIERKVILSGKNEPVIVAESMIYAYALPKTVLEDIRGRMLSLGSIINKHSLEVFRRVLEIGYDPSLDKLYRVYEMVHGGKVAMRIKEEIIRKNLP